MAAVFVMRRSVLGAAKRRNRLREIEIGLAKVVAATEERLLSQSRGCVSHAIAEVQRRGMAPFTKPCESVDRSLPVKVCERHDLDARLLEESKQGAGGVPLHAIREDESRFGSGGRADAGEIGVENRGENSLCIRFPEKDGEYG
jgi:hypothetical protein